MRMLYSDVLFLIVGIILLFIRGYRVAGITSLIIGAVTFCLIYFERVNEFSSIVRLVIEVLSLVIGGVVLLIVAFSCFSVQCKSREESIEEAGDASNQKEVL